MPAAVRELVRCRRLVAGGGPAGLMLGFLLARSGIDVLVLEKHADAAGPGQPIALPWPRRLLGRVRWLQRIPGRLIGIGFRPEHVAAARERYTA